MVAARMRAARFLTLIVFLVALVAAWRLWRSPWSASNLEIVPDSGLLPRAETGALVVRDFEGAWWVSAGDALRPMDAQETRARLAESLHGLRRLKPEHGPGGSEKPIYRYAHSGHVDPDSPAETAAQQRLHEWLAQLAPEDLPTGSYIARVESDPCLDELGLEVRWLEREHVVIGRLAEEDLLD